MGGTAILALGVLAGIALPGLAAWLAPLLPATVFVFVTATFLRADPALLRASLRRPREAVLLPAIAVLALPLGLAAALGAVGTTGPLAAALVLTLACPPTSATAALARLYGYAGEVPLTVILVTMLAAPVTLPLVAAAVGVALDPLALLAGLATLLGAAGAVAVGVRNFAGAAVARQARWLDRLILGALLIFALGAMEGVQARLLAAPAEILGLAALAFALSAGAMALGALLAPSAPGARAALGLTFGSRNVGLVWAVAGAALDPAITLFFAMFQLPIFVMPWLLTRIVAAGRAA